MRQVVYSNDDFIQISLLQIQVFLSFIIHLLLKMEKFKIFYNTITTINYFGDRKTQELFNQKVVFTK